MAVNHQNRRVIRGRLVDLMKSLIVMMVRGQLNFETISQSLFEGKSKEEMELYEPVLKSVYRKVDDAMIFDQFNYNKTSRNDTTDVERRVKVMSAIIPAINQMIDCSDTSMLEIPNVGCCTASLLRDLYFIVNDHERSFF